MAEKREIKVHVEFTEGYQKRYTEACLEQLRKRERMRQNEQAAEEYRAVTA